MENKLSRQQVLNLLQISQEKQTNSAIRKQQDIPFFDGTSGLIWHNEYSAKDSLRISKKGLWELKGCFKLFPIPL